MGVALGVWLKKNKAEAFLAWRMHVQHGYCGTGVHPASKSPAAKSQPCPGVLRSPVPTPATAGQSVCPGRSRSLLLRSSLVVSSSLPAAPCWAGGCSRGAGGGGGVPGSEVRRCRTPGSSRTGRSIPGAGTRSVARPGKRSGPGGAERGRTTGGGAPRQLQPRSPGGGRRSWSCGWGLSPWQLHALQPPWSCSGCCWLLLCSRSCPVSTPGTAPGGGKVGCHPAWMQRLSTAELAAVLGGMCEGCSAPKPCLPQLAGQLCRCLP